jgi:hypothetical protein
MGDMPHFLGNGGRCDEKVVWRFFAESLLPHFSRSWQIDGCIDHQECEKLRGLLLIFDVQDE